MRSQHIVFWQLLKLRVSRSWVALISMHCEIFPKSTHSKVTVCTTDKMRRHVSYIYGVFSKWRSVRVTDFNAVVDI